MRYAFVCTEPGANIAIGLQTRAPICIYRFIEPDGALRELVLDVTDYAILSELAFMRIVDGTGSTDRLSWLVELGIRDAGVTCGANGYR
jgi:hypothetical protein